MQELPTPNQLVPHELPPRKIPLHDAASMLYALCENIEAGAPLDEALELEFNDAKLALEKAVDRRIVFHRKLQEEIEGAERSALAYQTRAEFLKEVMQRFEQKTQAIVEANPNLPWKGEFGRIVIQVNPPAVKTALPSEKYLTPGMIEAFGIDERFIRSKTTLEINKTEVKEAIKGGATLTWATLHQKREIKFKE